MTDIDFLPASYRVSRRTRHVPYYRAGVIGLLAVILMGSTYGVELQKHGIQMQIQALEVQQWADAPQADKLRVLEDRCRDMEKTAKLLVLLQAEPKLSRVLAEVAQRTPPGVAVTKMSLTKQSARPARPGDRLKAGGQDGSSDPVQEALGRLTGRLQRQTIGVEIQGLATDDIRIAEYLGQLKACPLVHRAVLVVSRPHKGTDRERARSEFTIQCELLSPLASPGTQGRRIHAT